MTLYISSARAFVFDFDGVIYDSERLWLSVLKTMYSKYRVSFPQSDYVEGIGGTAADFDPFAYLAVRTSGLDAVTLELRGQREFEALALMEAPAVGLESLVKTAHSCGVLLAIASNTDRNTVLRYLAQVHLLHFFQAIVTKDEKRRPKPHPDVYTDALAALGCAAEDALAFEDSRRGIEAANSAGLTTISVPTDLSRQQDLTRAHYSVQSLSEVLLAADFQKATTRIEEKRKY